MSFWRDRCCVAHIILWRKITEMYTVGCNGCGLNIRFARGVGKGGEDKGTPRLRICPATVECNEVSREAREKAL